MKFSELNLIEPILRAVKEEGYETPTPIQEQAIPIVLGHTDLLGVAQTGTGKTAAFGIPILQILTEKLRGQRRPMNISALILTPTRELAIQIDESFRAYGRHTGLRTAVIFGGVGQKPQTDALQRGVDILVATPGRLLDLMNQGYIDLSKLSIFVLDEADRMLDMGFVHDVKKVIAKLPTKRQSLFFSATMPPDIINLANSILTDPQKVEVTPASSTADTVNQFIYFVGREDKKHLLTHIINEKKIQTALVFTRTKHGADKVVKELIRHNISAAAIHGNKGQSARQAALQNFKDRKIKVLVATDIAARGIDIDELGFVVNYDLPNIPESYVHRIGRTGRAGASGVAFSFCDDEEKEYLRDIQKLIGKVVPAVEDHPWPLVSGTEVPLVFPKAPKGKSPKPAAQPQQLRPKQQHPERNGQQNRSERNDQNRGNGQNRPERNAQNQPAVRNRNEPSFKKPAPNDNPGQQNPHQKNEQRPKPPGQVSEKPTQEPRRNEPQRPNNGQRNRPKSGSTNASPNIGKRGKWGWLTGI